MRSSLRVLAGLGLILLAVRPGLALTETGVRVRPVRADVFAPDWVWQGLRVNIVCVLANEGAQPVEASVRLAPGDGEWPFGDAVKPGAGQSVRIEAGQTARVALANLQAPRNMAAKTYPLRIEIEARAKTSLPYALQVVRGPAMDRSEQTMWVLAAVFLLWVGLMTWVLSRFASQGAWKRPSEVFEGGDAPVRAGEPDRGA